MAPATPAHFASLACAACGRVNATVCGVLFLFAFIYGSVVTCVILPWLSWSVPGVLNLFFLSASTLLALACFLACVFTDPGRVPEDYVPGAADAVVQVKRKGGEARFCTKCERHKPPRAHHCRLCRRCVLRMDHHCPWINGCVGHGNYRVFLQFLCYANAAVGHALGLFLAHAVHIARASAAHMRHTLRAGPGGGAVLGAAGAAGDIAMLWAILQGLATAVTLPLAVGLALLLGWNMHLVLGNKTTIEHHEGVTARIRAGAAYQHPYDLGPVVNLGAVCGPALSAWLVPGLGGPAASGDGLRFPTTWDARDPVLLDF